ncbi:sterol carrier protein domain-containing protein [Saccharomonospora sp. CUA-673]|uniref:sterol carrier protein domain-containing protein n=1 Tax=Saccharomonospora sp. CUA-673 TaxID=1904969 RepID=UPI0035116FC9
MAAPDRRARGAGRTHLRRRAARGEVTDPFLPANTGTYSVGPDGVTRTDRAPDLRLDVDALATVYLGARTRRSWSPRVVPRRSPTVRPSDPTGSSRPRRPHGAVRSSSSRKINAEVRGRGETSGGGDRGNRRFDPGRRVRPGR